MVERPLSPAVRGFGGIGFSPRECRMRDGICGCSEKNATKCGRSCSDNDECE